MHRIGGSLTIVAIIVLSGCIGASSAPASTTSSSVAPAPPPEPTAEFGSLMGLVTDDEKQPLVGVTVAILENEARTLSDEAGAFVFNDLSPGKYRLVTEKLGYESAARVAEVRVGEVTQITFALRSLADIKEPFMVVLPFKGFIQCSVNPNYAMFPCEGITGTSQYRFPFEIDTNYTVQEIVEELVWKPSTPGTAETMELDICLPNPDPVEEKLMCYSTGFNKYSTGPSPLSLLVAKGDLPKNDTKFIAAAGPDYRASSPNKILYQQPFNIYVSICYEQDCGENYTALPPN